ncbi:NAD(P)-dependent oxidoreductase [Fructilactobacillus florum]|uniref:D-lactate dehydrogenase n=2 Tax=Fructilactobacillus florum TaxID=640331 RepID=A0A0R2CMK0_9LACO|nr:NAD(P)-dependent oxidoreductase [Fructilactobacillus florum]KRM92290.1 D-lactate dehydrogenase [Fructilactobacillus florum DSM 22689 = JCM 16035]
MAKITVYNVQESEEHYYTELNHYDFELQLINEPLTKETAGFAQDSVGVLIDGTTQADADLLAVLKNMGVKYFFTRFAGYNNIDVDAANARGIMVAYVPSYSPFAVAELAMTLGLDLTRHIFAASSMTQSGDFRITPEYFSKEIDQLTVGIIGVGHIGSAEAKLYHDLGARVLGYQRHKNENSNVTFVTLEELLMQSDIVSLHVPYEPGVNDLMIGATELGRMKSNAVLVNTARGELVDTVAVNGALADQAIAGFGTDVLPAETGVSGKHFDRLEQVADKNLLELMKNYPNVIVTPHVGFNTEPAMKDMIKTSFANFHEALTTGKTINQLK